MSRWYALHIKNEILFWFIIVSIFPLVTLFSINYFLQKKQFETQAINQLEIILNEKIAVLENQIAHLESDIKLIATVPELIESFSHANEVFTRSGGKIPEIGALDTTINIFLEKNRYYDLFFINNNGDVVYSFKKEDDLGTNLASGIYKESSLALVYAKAKMLLETNISPFKYYDPSDEHAAFIAHPLYSQGKMIGVVAIQLSQSTIFAIFSDQKGLGKSGELFAAGVDKNNKIVSMTPLKYIKDSVKSGFTFPSRIDLSANKSVQVSSGSGISKDYRGIEVVSTWGYIPALNWGVVAKIDKEEVLAPIKTLEFYSWIMLFFVLLSILIAIVMATKHIVSPIDNLTKKVKKFSKGEFEEFHHAKEDFDVNNEIGILAENFNEMAQSIKISQETIQKYALELEDKVKQRTQELEHAKEELEEKNISMQISLDIIDKYVIYSSTNLAGTITEVSSAFCAITGYSREELLGKKHNIIRHPSMPSQLYKEMWESISNDRTWTGEIKNLKKDGTSYWVLSTISPKFDRYGKKIGYTSIRQDITDQKIVEELSITDALTGLYNRRHFNTMFEKILHSAQRKNELFCFLLLDIDHFKLYNDNYGHQMGDEVLSKFAATLRRSLKRADDYPFRLGGEEFGIIFNADTPQKALEFTQKVQENINSMKIPHEFCPVGAYISASIGLYCRHAKEIRSIEDIYKETDDLLYEAKKRGRDRIVSNFEANIL